MKLLCVLAMLLTGCAVYTVDPGFRGVKVTMGKVDPQVLGEGAGLKLPLFTTVNEVTIRQQSYSMKSEDYSADLQQVTHEVRVLYRIPEANVIQIFQNYSGNTWESLVEPRVQQALKAASARQTADSLVKKRDVIRAEALEAIRKDLNGLLLIDDIIIANEHLSDLLEKSIEAKMVQEQEAEKAVFTKKKAEMDAQTAIVVAEGQAKSLSIQGEAIRKNPETMQMELIKKWNGVSPMVVGAGTGTNILFPVGKKE